MKHLLLIFSLLFFFSCEDKKDTTPPETTITFPASGSTVNEVVNVTCMSTDNKGVEKVELWIDGVNTGLTDDTEPYSFIWNTTTYKDDNHTLVVRGYDTSDNEGDSPPITVKVDNTISVPNPVDITEVSYTLTEMTVKWLESTDTDFSKYSLLYSQSESGTKKTIETYSDKTTLSYTTTTFDPTKENWYWIEVADTFGYSIIGNGKTNKIDSPPTESTQYPIRYDGSSFHFRWSKNNDNDFAKYILYKSENSNLGNKTVFKEFTNQSDTTYIETNVAYDQRWYYQIAVADKWNLMNWSGSRTGSSYLRIIYSAHYHDGLISMIDINGESKETFNVIGIKPTFSPDAKKILYYTLEGEIHIMYRDGSENKKLTNSSLNQHEPIFSPDGSKIIYLENKANGLSDVWIMNVDGSNKQQLTDTEDYRETTIRITPNGEKIVYNRTYKTNGTGDIYIMNIDGSGQIPLTNNLNYGPDNFSFTPDGSKIIFEERETIEGQRIYNIFSMKLDGSEKTNLTGNTNEKAKFHYPVYNNDGTKIVYIYVDDATDYARNLYVMDADGSNKTNLTNETSSGGYETSIAISSDGDKIASSWRAYVQLVVMGIDGSNRKILTDKNGLYPNFEPRN